MSETANRHREDARKQLKVGILTVSDSRTLETDLGGKLIQEMVQASGHDVRSRRIVLDEMEAIQNAAFEAVQVGIEALLITGGTGLGKRDVTPNAIEPLFQTPIPGYGELFRMLSFQEIGAASMLSRAVAGVMNGMVVITMPGSPAGVRLAMEQLILPELPHLVHHARA